MFVNSSFILSIFMYEACIIWQSSEARQSPTLTRAQLRFHPPANPSSRFAAAAAGIRDRHLMPLSLLARMGRRVFISISWVSGTKRFPAPPGNGPHIFSSLPHPAVLRGFGFGGCWRWSRTGWGGTGRGHQRDDSV